jgi:voltage-gated potassium channel
MKRQLGRTLQAQLRDMRVLFRESRVSLFLFAAIVIGGALLFRYFYAYPGTGEHPPFGEALHATFALIFFETLLPFPEQWYLQVLFFVIPILGLAVVADGVLRFGTALLNKKARGEKWQIAMASTYNNHIIVCGIGKLGYRVILQLLEFGRDVVGIEANPEGRFVEKARALGIPLLIANARRSENLIKAGVKRAEAIIPCTDDELTNLDIALDACELSPDIKVIMRLFDADLAKRVEKGFGIHTAYSTSALAAPIFAAAAMRVNIKHSFYVGDQLLNLSEVFIQPGSLFIDWSLKKLEAALDLSVVCYQGKDVTDLHPDPELCLSVGDKVLVLASLETLERLSDINRPTAL